MLFCLIPEVSSPATLAATAHPVTMSNYVRPGLPYQVLEVKSVTGPLDVTPTLVEGDGLLGINLASDTMPAQLVEDAKVQTYFKTLYLFKFCILNPLLKLKFYKVEPTFLLLWSWSYSTILAWLQLVRAVDTFIFTGTLLPRRLQVEI